MIYLTKRPDLYDVFHIKVFDYYKEFESFEISIPIHIYYKDNYNDIIIYSMLKFTNYNNSLTTVISVSIPGLAENQVFLYKEEFYAPIITKIEYDINTLVFPDMSYFCQSIYFLDSINLPIFIYDNVNCLTNIKNLDNIHNIHIFNDVLSTFSSFNLFK